MSSLILTLLIEYVVMTYAFVGFTIFLSSAYIIGNYSARLNPVAYLKITGRLYLLKVAEEKELKTQISAFSIGFGYLNEYIKRKFKLGLVNRIRCCNFFKFTAFFGGVKEQNKIRLAVQNLILLLGKDSEQQTELSDIVSAIGDLMGKPIHRFEDLFEELDFEGILSKIAKHPHVTIMLGIIGAAPVVYIMIQILFSISSRLPVHFPLGL